VTFVVVWDLEHIPLLGRLLRAVGVLFIHRDDRAKAVSDVDHVVAAVEDGARVVVFPESTMSTVPGLRGFRSGAFMVGARTGVPVVPVALQGVDSVLHPDQRLPRPGTVRVAVGEPQVAKGSTWEDAMELRDRVRAELLALLDEPDLA
jgi:1-acyl-sn-glycerol-3-phosphate acyltransferase